jgi:CHAT domain-containing protein/tetratricopeptide (TPR) repeat protein
MDNLALLDATISARDQGSALSRRGALRIVGVALLSVPTLLLDRGSVQRDSLDKLLRAIDSSGVQLRGRFVGLAGPSAGSRLTRTLDVRAVAMEILKPSRATDPRAIGVAQFFAGQPDAAIESLRASARLRDASVRDWSDLAAVLLECGTTEDDPRQLGEALAAADRALERKPSMIEAQYNRAVALDALGLEHHAAEMARRYLAADTTSPWAASLRIRLKELAAPTSAERWKNSLGPLEHASEQRDTHAIAAIVNAFPQHARTWAEGEFLGQWADACLRNDVTLAAKNLQHARAVAAALAQRGDLFLADVVAGIDRHPVAARDIADAFVVYRDGRKLFASRRIAQSLAPLHESERRFRSLGSPLWRLNAYYLSNALMDADDVRGAQRALDRAEAAIPEHYLSLRAMCRWQQGNLLIREGDLYDALIETRRALDLFIRLGEGNHATRMRNSMATTLALMGRTTDAWTLRHTAVRAALRSGDRFLVEITLMGATRQAVREQQWAIARALLDAALADNVSSPRIRVDLLLWRAFADARMRGARLPANVDDAERAAQRLEDPKLREEALDWIRFAHAITLRASAPQEAIHLLTAVITWRQQNQRYAEIIAPYVERARALRALSRNADAISDLRHAINVIEAKRTEVVAPDIRDSFFGSAHDAFDELIDLYVARHDYANAFAVSEQKRARVLLDRLTPRWTAAAAPLATRLNGTQILHYTTLPQATLLNIFDSRGTRQLLLPIPRAELEARRDRFLEAIRHEDEQEARRIARQLYDSLLGAAAIGGGATVVFIPDEALSGIPFSALLDAQGRFLIEKAAVVVAPSAAMYLQRNAATRRHEHGPSLIVADPAFDTTRFPELPHLAAATREAQRIAQLLRGAAVLSGRAATPARVTELAQRSGVIHIAAHALTNPRNPSASFLILARGDHDSGLMHLDEIAPLRLDGTRLVVLAGCETATLSDGTGDLRSLAMGFLAAGSESVAASLWDIDDEAAAELSIAFYRHFASGRTPADALRFAQLDMLRSPDVRLHHVAAWAALQMYGTGL